MFKDYPRNSHLVINYLVSYATLAAEQKLLGDTTDNPETSFGWYDFYTYLQLKPGVDYKVFEKKLPAFCDRYINSQQWNKVNNVQNRLYLLPISDIHLYSNYNEEAQVNGNARAVDFMFLIGLIIMAIAWINYVNLASARSVERAKEVGVRKVLGAARIQLIRQFLLESFFLNLLAFIVGTIAAYLLTPYFNSLMGRENFVSFSVNLPYLFLLMGIFVSGTLLSGIYPAFVLSGINPLVY